MQHKELAGKVNYKVRKKSFSFASKSVVMF